MVTQLIFNNNIKMQEIYLLDIVSTEGKKEIRTTKKYDTRKELLEGYEIINKIFTKTLYLHSTGKIFLIPKIILTPKLKNNVN